MATLQVPGATLRYDVVGAEAEDRPLLVCIPGAQGSAGVFQPLAAALRDRFAVLTYDRRGFSGSALDGEQDYAHRLETDADDAAALIAHADKGPAVVLGSSSGAIVALTVLARHPEAVRALVAHEPPAARFLPNGEAMIAENYAIYDTWRASGIPAGMHRFMGSWMPVPTSDAALFQQELPEAAAAQRAKNMAYWFEHELRQYPAVEFDMAALRRTRDKLHFVMGEEMRGNPTTPIIEAMAAELDAPLHVFPGAHIGYAVKAPEFAEALAAILD